MRRETNLITKDIDEILTRFNMANISLDDLHQEIEMNHSELINKLALLVLKSESDFDIESAYDFALNTIVPWVVQKLNPDFIVLGKTFKEGKVYLFDLHVLYKS